MKLKAELSELQRLLAQTDLITGYMQSSNSGFVEALLAKRKPLKVKIYQEVGHSMPHVHVDYGRRHHVATYRVNDGERIEGNLDKKYDSDVSNWLVRNNNVILVVWDELQSGKDPKELIATLPEDL